MKQTQAKKQAQAKKPASPRKKKDKAVKVLAESAPVAEGELLTEVPSAQKLEMLTEVPPQAEGEILVEATDEVELITASARIGPDVFVSPTTPRMPVGLRRKEKEATEKPRQYTPQQVKKMRGEFSLRTLLTRFGIKL